MAVSAVSSTQTTSTTSTTKSGALDTDQFLQLLVGQLKNQNPMDPTDTNQLLNQMVSYASYGQQESTATTLEKISTTLDGISAALVLLLQEKQS